MLFTVVLTLPTDVSADAREAGGASALMLLVGYLIAAAAPFALGAVRDATGSVRGEPLAAGGDRGGDGAADLGAVARAPAPGTPAGQRVRV